MGNIGPWELALVLLIALIVFGPGKLPEAAKGLGKAVREFKQASNGVQKQFQEAIKNDEPITPVKTTTINDNPLKNDFCQNNSTAQCK